ncbi:Clavaminate synthase-like protein [Armillaria gallica]|uniref:Clavaminate synthase-like protein n=1 Tax=Armillaria gallica TaxID=47427 RepID=A0A2H3DKS3_ARMGA|nr:Clavaminate synthase-like protein [Armillaria gallica]
MAARPVPYISLRNFDLRKDEIAKELIDAAENVGFFVLVDQESPSKQDISDMFELSARYFALPEEIKAKVPFIRDENCGWEKDAQVRPSTGVADPKESLQLQAFRADTYWPTDLPGIPEFREKCLEFMDKTQTLSLKILSFFAVALGFPPEFFTEAHDTSKGDCLSTLRLLQYHDAMGKDFGPNSWRAGAHTDFDCLTLLYQQDGGDGLEVCPGREAHTSFAQADDWTPVPARTGDITVNVGDMLMAWSEDRFKSLFHRVRAPGPNDNKKPRLSIGYFNQPRPGILVDGPTHKYAAQTAKEYIVNAMHRNYLEAQQLKKEPQSVVINAPAVTVA